MEYVLITPARNEEANIRRSLDTVVAQTLRPLRWVIVDDGSSDETATIVLEYCAAHDWIVLVSRPARERRSFGGKADAVAAGLARVESLTFDVIGNLDADITFAAGYMEFLIGRFQADQRLGVAGTPFTEEGGYDTAHDSFEGGGYVAGGVQLFRRRCFEEVGGYVHHAAGGVDWIAVMTAKMKGWKVRSFPEMRFHHHRPLGTAERGRLAALFSYGEKDYYLGGSPLWQACRVAYRASRAPYVAGGLALGAGYLWAAMRRTKRPVSAQLMAFHRKLQMQKLRTIASRFARGQRVDGFSLENE